MNILFQVSYVPSLIRTRPYNFIRGLLRRGHSITLATLWENQAERAALEELSRLEGLRIIASPLQRARIVVNLMQALRCGEPLQAWYSWQPAFAHELERELRSTHYDVVHSEHLRGARYGLHLLRAIQAAAGNVPVVYDSVDCISLLYRRAASCTTSRRWRWITWFELLRTQRYEARLARSFDRLLATTEADRRALQELAVRHAPPGVPAANVDVVTNGVDLDYFAVSSRPRCPDALVFSGKMSFHANYTMAMYLIRSVMPLVWARRPAAELWIVGASPAPDLVRAAGADHRVKLTAWTPDMRPFLQQASLAIVPLLYGTGIQNKVLEAMACGTPVVATSLAAQALAATPGEDIIVADGTPEMADAIVRLLDDKRQQRTVGLGGRWLVERDHDWNRIACRLEHHYEESRATGPVIPE